MSESKNLKIGNEPGDHCPEPVKMPNAKTYRRRMTSFSVIVDFALRLVSLGAVPLMISSSSFEPVRLIHC